MPGQRLAARCGRWRCRSRDDVRTLDFRPPPQNGVGHGACEGQASVVRGFGDRRRAGRRSPGDDALQPDPGRRQRRGQAARARRPVPGQQAVGSSRRPEPSPRVPLAARGPLRWSGPAGLPRPRVRSRRAIAPDPCHGGGATGSNRRERASVVDQAGSTNRGRSGSGRWGRRRSRPAAGPVGARAQPAAGGHRQLCPRLRAPIARPAAPEGGPRERAREHRQRGAPRRGLLRTASRRPRVSP